MKQITRNVGLLVVLIASFLAFAVAPVAAEDTITGSRTILDTTVAPGDTFTVSVTVDITGTVYGPVLNEDVPAGWAVTEVDNADGTYNAADTKWLWSGSQTADKTVTYNVTVPDETTDGSYDITGTVLATVSGTTVSHSVGTDHVTVAGATDTITGSRTISDTTVAPGDTFTVIVTVDITGTVYGPVLNEDVPAGWAVTEVDNADGTYNAADTKWLWSGLQTADKTVTYNVTVPDETTDGSYNIAGTVLATVSGTTVSHSVGTDHVTVSDGGPVTLTWQNDPPESVMQGSSVTFDVSFSAPASYYARIENSTGVEVWRYPTLGTGTTADPPSMMWETTSVTPGDYTIVININGDDNADEKPVAVTAAALQNIVTIGDVTREHGATTDVPIRLVNSTGVGGGQVTLMFNPSIVNTTNVIAGDFDNSTAFSPDYSNVSNGVMRVTFYKDGTNLTGDRTIATVTLDAVGTSGSCALGLSAELTEKSGDIVPSSVGNGTFTISAAVLESVTISPTSSDLITGETQQFTATCHDTNSNTLAGCTLTWTCNSPAIGTIGSSSGLFTAGGVGTATVTVSATYEGVTKTDTAVVNVSAPVETVDLTDTDNFTEDVDAGTAADVTVNGTFDNGVTGSINITPVADPEEVAGSYEFTGNDEALLGLTVAPDDAIAAELADGNGTIRIEVCYNATELTSKAINLSTLALWRFDGTDWVQMVAGTPPCVANGITGNCVWIDVNNLSTFALVGTTDANPMIGDINGDSTINMLDAIHLAKYYTGAGSEMFRTIDDDGDINSDSTINMLDAIHLAKYYTGAGSEMFRTIYP